MTINSTQFRQIMRRYPTGVTVLTVRTGEHIHGMTANSFTSVSLDPTLVLVCINNKNVTHQLVTRAGTFALNILSEHQIHLAQRFAHQVEQPANPFADIAYHTGITGAPLFDDSVAYLDCKVVAAHPAGDHTIFIGEVQMAEFGNARDVNPLMWLDGKYTLLSMPELKTMMLVPHLL